MATISELPATIAPIAGRSQRAGRQDPLACDPLGGGWTGRARTKT